MEPAYKRVLLKISGEALAGEQKFGIDHVMVNDVANTMSVITMAMTLMAAVKL